MNPLHLSLRNCRTFQEIDLDLPEGLLAILGANGAGKSTIINAIDVALFGPIDKKAGLAPWYPRSGGEDPMVITLTFEHAGETYRVRRSFSPKGRGTSKTDVEHWIARGLQQDAGWDGGIVMREGSWEPLTVESQKATGEVIEWIIGLSRPTFRASSFLAQNEAGVFCEAAARARKAILTDILGLGEWDRWLERARTEKRAAESELDRIAGAVARAEEELADQALVAGERKESLALKERQEVALQDALDWLAAHRAEASQAEAQAAHHAAAERAVRDAADSVNVIRDRIDERKAEIRIIDTRLTERQALHTAAQHLPFLVEEREALRIALEQWRERDRIIGEISRLEAERGKAETAAVRLDQQAVTVLEGGGNETCDRCGQTLHAEAAQRAAQSFRDDALAMLSIVARCNDQQAPLTATLVDLPTEEPDSERMPQLERACDDARMAKERLAALDEAAARRDQAEEEADRMRVELLSREQLWVAARDALAALDPHDPTRLAVLRDEIDKHEQFETTRRAAIIESERRIASADTQLERLAKIAADVSRSRVRRDELHAEAALLADMERACGPNGVPALILENVAIPQIEVEASRILALLGGPAYACELRTLREKKTGGISDTLDVILLTETGDAPYESFSGGERARIAFALRLALAQLLASRKGSATGLLVIDELEGLDAQGIAALVSVLEGLQESIPRIIVVSHVAEMRDSFENTLLLKQVDGESQIISELPAEMSA